VFTSELKIQHFYEAYYGLNCIKRKIHVWFLGKGSSRRFIYPI